MKDRTVFLHFSSLCHDRLPDWLRACGQADLIEAMMKVHQYSMMCASILAQDAAVKPSGTGRKVWPK